MQIITSQHHLDESIIDEKRANKDYDVFVSPVFELDGEEMAVLLDGNHSFEAAMRDGVAPVVTEYTATEADQIALLEDGDIDGFLAACHMGEGDYVYASRRNVNVW
jgi:hypothetical protein